jgi:hypothetical protein
MKKVRSFFYPVKLFGFLFLLSLIQTAVWAQDGGADINVKISKDDGEWYTKPWVWVVGAAVFILLLVAILRGGNNKSA